MRRTVRMLFADALWASEEQKRQSKAHQKCGPERKRGIAVRETKSTL